MTTKVRITNIADDVTHSNGDVVIDGLPGGRLILAPGQSVEEWLLHENHPLPVVITERWPHKPKA